MISQDPFRRGLGGGFSSDSHFIVVETKALGSQQLAWVERGKSGVQVHVVGPRSLVA